MRNISQRSMNNDNAMLGGRKKDWQMTQARQVCGPTCKIVVGFFFRTGTPKAHGISLIASE
jgi:hypothetical protein